jgi:hypothetical protein
MSFQGADRFRGFHYSKMCDSERYTLPELT